MISGPQHPSLMQIKELRDKIVSYLPKYRSVGKHNIGTVAKAWKNYPRPTKRAEVVKSCRTPEDALFILNDEGLYNQLSLDAMLDVVSAHPDLAKKFVDKIKMSALTRGSLDLQEEFCFDNNHFVETLPPYMAAMLQKMIDNKVLIAQPQFSMIFRIALKQEIIALDMLNDWVIFGRLTGNDLMALGYAHESVALEIFKSPALLNRLEPKQLVFLGCHHSIMLRLLNDPALASKVKSTRPFLMATYLAGYFQGSETEREYNYFRDKVAKSLQLPLQRDEIDGELLLALWHFDAAKVVMSKYIAQTDYQEVSLETISLLGKKFKVLGLKLAEYLLVNFDGSSIADRKALFSILDAHPSLIFLLLSNQALQNKLFSWEPIVSNAEMVRHLDKDFQTVNAYGAENFKTTIEYLTKSNKYKGQLPGSWLFFYARNDTKTCQMILDDETLSQKLSPQQRAVLNLLINPSDEELAELDGNTLLEYGRVSEQVALRIIKEPNVRKNIDKKYGYDFRSLIHHKEVAKWMLSHKKFLKRHYGLIASHHAEYVEECLQKHTFTSADLYTMMYNEDTTKKLINNQEYINTLNRNEIFTFAARSKAFKKELFFGMYQHVKSKLSISEIAHLAKDDPAITYALLSDNKMLKEFSPDNIIDAFGVYLDSAMHIVSILPVANTVNKMALDNRIVLSLFILQLKWNLEHKPVPPVVETVPFLKEEIKRLETSLQEKKQEIAKLIAQLDEIRSVMGSPSLSSPKIEFELAEPIEKMDSMEESKLEDTMSSKRMRRA